MENGARRAAYVTDNMALAALLSLHDFEYSVVFGREAGVGCWKFLLADLTSDRVADLAKLVQDFENGVSTVEPVSFQQAISAVRSDLFRLLDSRKGQSRRIRNS